MFFLPQEADDDDDDEWHNNNGGDYGDDDRVCRDGGVDGYGEPRGNVHVLVVHRQHYPGERHLQTDLGRVSHLPAGCSKA